MQWVWLWAGLIAFAAILWGTLIARLVRKARLLRDRLRVMAGQTLDSPSPADARQM